MDIKADLDLLRRKIIGTKPKAPTHNSDDLPSAKPRECPKRIYIQETNHCKPGKVEPKAIPRNNRVPANPWANTTYPWPQLLIT